MKIFNLIFRSKKNHKKISEMKLQNSSETRDSMDRIQTWVKVKITIPHLTFHSELYDSFMID